MAVEFPFGTIHQLQISLRKVTNIPSYDPRDASPAVEDSISRLDPSPPYLRCKHCKGRLLRGINSLFCVFCGREQWTEAPPDPINFRSTAGYEWLLQSLQLDGSEIVELTSEGNESSRGQNTPKQQPLSDLLNLEIEWHPKLEQPRTSATESPSLNLAGVDLDDFFVEAKTEINFKQPEQQNHTLDSNVFQGHQDLSLFESQPSIAPASSTAVETDNSQSEWETKFQSFGSGKESSKTEPKWSAEPSSYSNEDDWFQDDPRSNPITATNNSSANMGWFQNDQWQNSSSNLHSTNDNDDDDWDDFASSVTIKDQGIPSVQNSGMDLFSVSVQEKDGGGCQQPDLFSGAFQSPIDPPNMNLQASDSERAIGEGILNAASPKTEVEMLISQMHDLSFMLDSNLSVPRPTGKT